MTPPIVTAAPSAAAALAAFTVASDAATAREANVAEHVGMPLSGTTPVNTAGHGGMTLSSRTPGAPITTAIALEPPLAHKDPARVYVGWAFDSTKGYPGEGHDPPQTLHFLSWNVNGAHLKRRHSTGEAASDSDDEPLGDGHDLRADTTDKFARAMSNTACH